MDCGHTASSGPLNTDRCRQKSLLLLLMLGVSPMALPQVDAQGPAVPVDDVLLEHDLTAELLGEETAVEPVPVDEDPTDVHEQRAARMALGEESLAARDFDQLDLDHNERIELSEWLGFPYLTEELFEATDTSGDAAVTRDEVEALLKAAHARTEAPAPPSAPPPARGERDDGNIPWREHGRER